MRTRILFTAVVAAIAAAAVATAAPTPDATVTLSAATPEFSWDGTAGQNVDTDYAVEDCSKESDNFCDIYLLDIQSSTPVTVDASLTDFSNPIADFDLRIHKPDPETNGPGEEIPSNSFTDDPTQPYWGGPNGLEEFVHIENLAPGQYWLVAHHYFNPNATYKGHVKVTGATGGATPPPSGGGGGTPPPSGGGGGGTPPPSGGGGTNNPAPGSGPAALPFKASSSLGSARKVNKKKSLIIKATASQDISGLVLTLVDSKKKKVGSAKVASFKKGSKKIKMKVKKLKAGTYQLIAEGTVNGAKQTMVQKVKVKK